MRGALLALLLASPALADVAPEPAPKPGASLLFGVLLLLGGAFLSRPRRTAAP